MDNGSMSRVGTISSAPSLDTSIDALETAIRRMGDTIEAVMARTDTLVEPQAPQPSAPDRPTAYPGPPRSRVINRISQATGTLDQMVEALADVTRRLQV